MRGLIKFAWAPLLAVSAMAAPFTLNTGSAAWQVTQVFHPLFAPNSGLGFNNPAPAVVLTGTIPVAPHFGGPWVTPPAGSAWVGQLATDGNVAGFGCSGVCGAVAGAYEYTLTFAAGFGGTFSFSFASDNYVSFIRVEQASGITTLYTNNGGTSNQGSLTSISTFTYAAGAGNVTIRARVINDPLTNNPTDRNPSGFLVSGSGNSNDVIPEPSTYAMLGLGLSALVVARMRRK